MSRPNDSQPSVRNATLGCGLEALRGKDENHIAVPDGEAVYIHLITEGYLQKTRRSTTAFKRMVPRVGVILMAFTGAPNVEIAGRTGL